MTAFLDFIKNKNLSFIEVESLLNLMDLPSILVDEENTVILVNSALLEMTAFTKQEIINTPLRSLILEERKQTGKVRYRVLRKNRVPLEIELRREFLHANHRWKIYSLIQKVQDEIRDYETIQSFIKNLKKLTEISDETSSSFYNKSLQILNQIFHFDLLVFYQQEDDKFKISDKGDQKIMGFPKDFSVEEITSLEGYELWQQGNRAINILHRKAREEAINTMFLQRLRSAHGMDSILVVGWNEYIRNAPLLALVEEIMDVIAYSNSIFDKQISNFKMQEEKEKIEEVFHYLEDNIEEGLIYLDDKKIILDINPKMEQLLGYTKWEAQALPLDSYLVTEPKIDDLFHEIFENKIEIGDRQLLLRRRDGNNEPVKLRIIPCDEDRTHFLIIIQSTRQFDELKKNLKEMEHQANLGKSVATFAHEVRNPINNIVTGLQVLQTMTGENAVQSEMINRMMNDCARLDHLMNSILSYAKPLENKLRPINLDLLVQNILEKWEEKLDHSNIKTVYQCEKDLPMIAGDIRSLEQVFTNLINNAIEAMKAQEKGTLAIKIEKLDQNNVTVNVSDTGPGIPDEILKKIFTPFVSFSLKGTGLGLAIIKEIIDAHKGKISVESFPGGTVFNIILPFAKGE